MACCPRCGEPMVSTLEFSYAEFYCQVCGHKCGYLSPVGKTWTRELQDRHDELRAQYDIDRKQRKEEASGRANRSTEKS